MPRALRADNKRRIVALLWLTAVVSSTGLAFGLALHDLLRAPAAGRAEERSNPDVARRLEALERQQTGRAEAARQAAELLRSYASKASSENSAPAPASAQLFYAPIDMAAKEAAGLSGETWNKIQSIQAEIGVRRDALMTELQARRIAPTDFSRGMVALGAERDEAVAAMLEPSQWERLNQVVKAREFEKLEKAREAFVQMKLPEAMPPNPGVAERVPTSSREDF